LFRRDGDHGGTSMAQWSPPLRNKGGASLYGAMMRRYEKLGQPIAGLLWYQGESDANREAASVYTQKMIERFDSPMGRHIYSRRMGTVEPVFANIRNALKLDRFTLRGKKKVNIQWNLFCMVHNIGKIAKFGTIGV